MTPIAALSGKSTKIWTRPCFIWAALCWSSYRW